MITINPNQSVYELIKQHPKLKHLMVELGFNLITLPGMLETAGKIMTLKKGIKHKGIEEKEVITLLKKNGYQWEETYE